jgi:hypothetical protein
MFAGIELMLKSRYRLIIITLLLLDYHDENAA